MYKKLYLPGVEKPMYVVAYRSVGYHEPVILLSDMAAENSELALRIRNQYVRRWDCESSMEFLKSRMDLERFAVRRYRSIQHMVFFACLAAAFLSYLQPVGRGIRERVNDNLRYCRLPMRLWCYRILIALQDAYRRRANAALL